MQNIHELPQSDCLCLCCVDSFHNTNILTSSCEGVNGSLGLCSDRSGRQNIALL